MAFFAERRERADMKAFDRLMRRQGGAPLRPDDRHRLLRTTPQAITTRCQKPRPGVRGDMIVFLWTEIAGVIAAGSFVSTWARHGPRP